MWSGGESRMQQRMDELCELVPDLAFPTYRSALKEIFSLLSENDVELTYDYTGSDQASTDWDPASRHPPGVTLPVGNGKERGLSVLWDLAHELGHLLLFNFGRAFPSTPSWYLIPHHPGASSRREALEQLAHEKDAWHEAEGFLTDTLALLQDGTLREDFHRRRESCLDSYRDTARSFDGGN